MKVVGRCGGSCQQPVRHLAHEIGDLIAAGAVSLIEEKAARRRHVLHLNGLRIDPCRRITAASKVDGLHQLLPHLL
jgi:hypothetical protein